MDIKFSFSDLISQEHTKTDSLVRLNDPDDGYSSFKFQQNKLLLQDIFSNSGLTTRSTDSVNSVSVSNSPQTFNFNADSVAIKPWKSVENISARLIEFYDNVVVLECLIDKENGIYEEREFRSSLFNGYDMTVGNLFYLRIFDRDNQTRMEVHNDPDLTNAEDFPKMNFTKLFSNSKLFAK
jgi:hypothetical protein